MILFESNVPKKWSTKCKGKKAAYSSARLIEKRKYFNDLEKLGRKKRKVKK